MDRYSDVEIEDAHAPPRRRSLAEALLAIGHDADLPRTVPAPRPAPDEAGSVPLPEEAGAARPPVTGARRAAR